MTGFLSLSYAQTVEEVLTRVYPVPSPTGSEHLMAGKIMQVLPESLSVQTDNMGSVYLNMGRGKRRLCILTGMDEFGYFVSRIRSDGFLTIDRAVPVPYPLFDFHRIGHPVRIWTAGGQVQGVLALPSLHIASRKTRRNLQAVLTLDNALVDVGARTEKEVISRGIRMLDAVTPRGELTKLAGNRLSGPALGVKAGIAALLSAALSARSPNTEENITLVWLAQSKFPSRRSRPRAALSAVQASLKLGATGFLVLDTIPCESDKASEIAIGQGPVLFSGDDQSPLANLIIREAERKNILLQKVSSANSIIFNAMVQKAGQTVGLFIPVKFADSPAEVIDLADVESMTLILRSLVEGRGK